jgi:uncharacterized SAM-binding protein YcdF (DUF218 family)
MMSGLISYDFLIPPTGLILVSAAAAWFTLWRPRFGIAVLIVTTSLLYLAALPVIAARMHEDIEIELTSPPDFSGAQAIVVLGGGLNRGDGDKISDSLGPLTLERLAFATRAYRRLNLPIAVSGGQTSEEHAAEAPLMKAALEGEFRVPVKWVEDQARTTYENAIFTKRLLAADNVTTVVLVTHSWHMRRALWAFERAGLRAIPWPAPLTYDAADRIDDYLPSMRALEDSHHALHEAIGLLYYRLRY